jgi:hypothetical protein
LIKILLAVGLLALLIASCNVEQQKQRHIDKQPLSAQALIASPNSSMLMNTNSPVKVPAPVGMPTCISAYWWAKKLRQRVRGAR